MKKRKLFLGPVLIGLLALGIIGSGAVFAQTAEPDRVADHGVNQDHGADHGAN